MSQKFNIIYADPAWSYNDKCHSGKRGAGYKYTVTGTAGYCGIVCRETSSGELHAIYVGHVPNAS